MTTIPALAQFFFIPPFFLTGIDSQREISDISEPSRCLIRIFPVCVLQHSNLCFCITVYSQPKRTWSLDAQTLHLERTALHLSIRPTAHSIATKSEKIRHLIRHHHGSSAIAPTATVVAVVTLTKEEERIIELLLDDDGDEVDELTVR